MTNIIILDKNGKNKTSEVQSYSTKELLQIMKNKTNKLKLKKGELVPKILLSLNIDNFQIHLLGWNDGNKKDINKQFDQIISNNKKRINAQIHSDFYGDLVIVKSTLSTKILNMSHTEYQSILEILNNTNKTTKKPLKLKAKYNLDDSDDELEEENEEDKEKSDEETDNEKSSDEDSDQDDNVYNNEKLKKKFQELDSDEEVEDEDNDNDNYDENDENDENEELDDVDNNEPDEDFAPIAVEALDVKVEKKHKNTRKQKKTIDLDIYNDMLTLEKKGNINNNLNTIRQKCMETINTLVDDTKISRQIEQGVYNYCVLDSSTFDTTPRWDNNVFSGMYINKVRSIYTNLNSKSYLNNVNFIQKFKDEEYDPYDLAFLKPYEIFPEKWEKIREEEYRRNKLLYQTKEVAMTDEYKCRRCKKRETSYFELQIRSADEPATLFITCINCGNRWTRNP
jgi:DNA-directed RNA polymerase subunit M/transcription elongation factor TFIIS